MKKLLFVSYAIVSSVFLTKAANAADITAPSAYDWTGFYIGVQGGYAWSHSNGDVSIPESSDIGDTARGLADDVLSGEIDGSSFVGGATVGANYQVNNWLIGVEGDLSVLGIDEERSDSAVDGDVDGDYEATGTDHLDGDVFATMRLRAGWVAGNTLLYVTGGLAYTDAEVSRTLDWSYEDDCPIVGAGLQRCHSGSEEFGMGWTVGAGLEHAFNESWSVKAEYLYADFGEVDFDTSNLGIDDQDMKHEFDLNVQVIRAGLNYRF
jgi:outer membrane immunogenic protein